ncbi:pyrimidodiazepine synthase isoform X2 [Aethina tumida]|uniref:pyrimidodiazepine synthase isoform X2 n=1 Tax=Aethina tumida TaxID=116153 RepID=UPI00096B09DD|nr:pyrimidodiazepine synthase isoform X2 [Aethina tumida]
MSSPHLTKGSRTPPSSPKGKLRLYSNRFCPYSQRVHLVLDAKKIPYDVVNINLSSKPDWYYDKSPYGKVPALELDTGDVLYESLIISDYLDERYHQHQLHSNDPLQKAKDRLLIEQFNKVVNTMYKVLLTVGRTNMDDDVIIANGLDVFERELGDRIGPYFGGKHPGMLDFMIWPWCERADLLKLFGNQNLLKKEKYPRLMEWKKQMSENPSVKKSMLDSATHIKFLHSQRAGMPDYDAILNSI